MSPDTDKAQAAEGVGLLLAIAPFVQKSAHEPGKIKLSMSLLDLPKLMNLLKGVDLDAKLSQIPGLKKYEVSSWTRTATVTYDPAILPVDLWEDFCRIRDNPEVAPEVEKRLMETFTA